MFILKKILSQFFNPVMMLLALLFLAAGLLIFTKRTTLGKTLLAITCGLVALFSFPFIPDLLMSRLETRHEAYDVVRHGRVPFVVVLGGGAMYDPAFPVTSRVAPCAMTRLVEGIRIHALNPGSALVLSGGAVLGSPAKADMMAEIAMSIGVEPQRLILEKQSRDTATEAQEVKKIVASHPFALVTSASHMPRSMGLFRKAGMNPIAAPTEFVTFPNSQGPLFFDFFPSVHSFSVLNRALHEYVGILWGWMTGQL